MGNFRGVYYDKRLDHYRAQIKWGGHRIFLGSKQSPDAAATLYDAAARLLYRGDARPNFDTRRMSEDAARYIIVKKRGIRIPPKRVADMPKRQNWLIARKPVQRCYVYPHSSHWIMMGDALGCLRGGVLMVSSASQIRDYGQPLFDVAFLAPESVLEEWGEEIKDVDAKGLLYCYEPREWNDPMLDAVVLACESGANTAILVGESEDTCKAVRRAVAEHVGEDFIVAR